MKKPISVFSLCVFLAGTTGLHAIDQDMRAIVDALQQRERQYFAEKMVYESRAEIKAVTAGLLMVPATLFICVYGFIGSIGAGIATSDKVLALTGSQDFATGMGICAGGLVAAGCLYTMHLIYKDICGAADKVCGA